MNIFMLREALASCAIEGNKWAERVLYLMNKTNKTKEEQKELDKALITLYDEMRTMSS